MKLLPLFTPSNFFSCFPRHDSLGLHVSDIPRHPSCGWWTVEALEPTLGEAAWLGTARGRPWPPPATAACSISNYFVRWYNLAKVGVELINKMHIHLVESIVVCNVFPPVTTSFEWCICSRKSPYLELEATWTACTWPPSLYHASSCCCPLRACRRLPSCSCSGRWPWLPASSISWTSRVPAPIASQGHPFHIIARQIPRNAYDVRNQVVIIRIKQWKLLAGLIRMG